MYTVFVNYADGTEWHAIYTEYENAVGVLYELTEFGGEGCIMDESTGGIFECVPCVW